MKTKRGNSQSGISMLAITGIIALVAVVSIGGISAYSAAKERNSINRTIRQVKTIVATVKALYPEGNYVEIKEVDDAIKIVARSQDALSEICYSEECTSARSDYGRLNIKGHSMTDKEDYRYFYVDLFDLTPKACVTLALNGDWGYPMEKTAMVADNSAIYEFRPQPTMQQAEEYCKNARILGLYFR